MTIDASPHLPLIRRVIGQLGLRGDQADEAYSLGLVTIVEASQSYDPNRGPLASWLANNIKWSIRNWLAKERKFGTGKIIHDHGSRDGAPQSNFRTNGNPNDFYVYENDVEDIRADISLQFEIKETLEAVQELCSVEEQRVLALGVQGFSGKEIAQKLHITQVQVTRLKQRARAKLVKFLAS